jgi:hypothetical protein
MRGMTRALLTLAALAAAAVLAACGAETPASSSGGTGPEGPDAKTKKAMLAYAKCMREHGIDMPDPQFSAEGGGAIMRQRAGKATPEQQREAQEACKKYQEQVKPPELTAEQKEEFKKAALANAKCMRDHGVDVPDPQFGEDGGVRMKIEGKGLDDAKVAAAAEACRKTTPDIGGEK